MTKCLLPEIRCQLKFKSAHLLIDLKLKIAHLVFNNFIPIFEKSVAGFVGMWESRRLFQVIVESVGKSFVISRMETLFPIG
jgi:hypothetical protein